MGAETLYSQAAIVLDFETTARSHGDAWDVHNRVVLAAWKTQAEIEWAEEEWRERLRPALLAARVLVAHNARFELAWLEREGLPWRHLLVWDTMLAERVIHGNILKPVGLDATCRRYGLATKEPIIDALMRGGVCPSEQPRKLLIDRCRRDVMTTWQLFRRQMAHCTASGQLGVVLTRSILVPPLVEIECAGMQLDRTRVYDEYARVAKGLGEIEGELTRMTGGINMRSAAQLAHFIYGTLHFKELTRRGGAPLRNAPSKQFPDGAPKTDQKTLAKLKATTKAQRRFLELRKEYGKLNARMVKCLRFYKGVVDDYGGRFRAQFHQTRTATHRLSCTARPLWIEEFKAELGAQLQNQPREYKKLFCSDDPDYLVVEVDGAQLEFRVAVQLGQDKQGCRDIVGGEDIHRYTASVLCNVPEEQVTPQQRTDAKPDTFKPLYGGEYGTEAQMRYYKAFREKYPDVYRTQMGWLGEAVNNKCVRMPWGMEFRFPDIRLDGGDGYCKDKPSVFNYPVQNLATAEIIPVSLTYLFWRCRLEGLRVKFVNTVHDSVVCLVHRNDLERFVELAQQAFLEDTYYYLEQVYGIEMTVPLGLGIKAGKFWGEGDERKYSKPYKRVLAS